MSELYKIVTEDMMQFEDEVERGEKPKQWDVARSIIDDGYIGVPALENKDGLFAFFQDHDIVPQKSPSGGGDVCCIGFSEKEQKWYGWSHRGGCGFGPGSTVKKGDCAYVPEDYDAAVEDAIEFWSDEDHINVRCENTKIDPETGRMVLDIEWDYSDDIPNKKLRKTIGGVNHWLPEKWGRGEWTAETMEDAKQMAIDYAEGVG